MPGSCQLVDPVIAQLMPYISFLVYSFIPIIVISVLCSLIWHTLGQLPVTYLHGGIRLQDQVTRMIMAQIISIIVTSLLSAAYSLGTISTRTIKKSSQRLAVETLVNTICVLIGFLTHEIIFYIYLIASVTFRKNAATMFHAGFSFLLHLLHVYILSDKGFFL